MNWNKQLFWLYMDVFFWIIVIQVDYFTNICYTNFRKSIHDNWVKSSNKLFSFNIIFNGSIKLK